MAAPVITTDLVDIIADMPNTTGWTLISDGGGGPNSLTAPEEDYFIQGDNCISRNPWTSANIRGMLYNTTVTIPAGAAVFAWCWAGVSAAIRTEANGGMQVCVGNLTTAFKAFYVRGSDTYAYGGWVCIPVDPTLTADATVGAPSTVTSQFGVRWGIAVSGPQRGFPFAIDAIRYGRTLQVVDGVGDSATFVGVATQNDLQANRWGLFQEVDGGYLQQGLFLMGTAGTAVDFRDANRNIAIANTKKVNSVFNTYEVRNASSVVEWTNITISALGTVSKGRFLTTDNATLTKIGCSFTGMGVFNYLSNSTLTDCTYRRCDLVTQASASFDGCNFETSTGAVALLSNNPSDVVDCTFTRGATGHAIEITTPGSYTFIGNEFYEYVTADGATGNEVIYNNSGGAVTLNVTGGAGVLSVRNGAGSTTTIIAGAVTVTVTVLDPDNDPIENARVLVRAVGGGALPASASVSITRSGSTATVTHTAHGLLTGDKALILGAAEREYNGVFTVTNTGVNTYTYTVSGTPATPATGTPTSTFVVLEGLTNVSGEITASRVYSGAQPVSGSVRKSTGSPLFRARSFPGSVSSTAGLSVTVPLERDE